MRRYRIVVAYDGTNYCGWQVQPNGITVEEVLNKKISKITGEDIHIIGASRTDSGVHSMGNVAVFDTNTSIPAEIAKGGLSRCSVSGMGANGSCSTTSLRMTEV